VQPPEGQDAATWLQEVLQRLAGRPTLQPFLDHTQDLLQRQDGLLTDEELALSLLTRFLCDKAHEADRMRESAQLAQMLVLILEARSDEGWTLSQVRGARGVVLTAVEGAEETLTALASALDEVVGPQPGRVLSPADVQAALLASARSSALQHLPFPRLCSLAAHLSRCAAMAATGEAHHIDAPLHVLVRAVAPTLYPRGRFHHQELVALLRGRLPDARTHEDPDALHGALMDAGFQGWVRHLETLEPEPQPSRPGRKPSVRTSPPAAAQRSLFEMVSPQQGQGHDRQHRTVW
jgi:hypothetical protein